MSDDFTAPRNKMATMQIHTWKKKKKKKKRKNRSRQASVSPSDSSCALYAVLPLLATSVSEVPKGLMELVSMAW